ncbi:uncharacterized protein LOC129581995 [Paramacrobiotus metropolitanus]|uniref:uncharacterized protein LOC129581995 n=1 Tax=Paramacrobiotus metropolitanus TaxID=2943436 RepID=UPI0024456251|nr:uncharacterized protein LOC129581995 [Paramacrobiotus metropolitanus]
MGVHVLRLIVFCVAIYAGIITAVEFNAFEERCGFDGIQCLGIPRGCIQPNGTSECSATGMVSISPMSPGVVRILLTGEHQGNTTNQWIGIDFSEDGEPAGNTTGIQCRYQKGQVAAKLTWTTNNETSQMDWTAANKSALIGTNNTTNTTSTPQYRCSVDIPSRFALNGSMILPNRMAYRVFSAGVFSGERVVTNVTDLYLVSRVRPDWSADERMFLSYCTEGRRRIQIKAVIWMNIWPLPPVS